MIKVFKKQEKIEIYQRKVSDNKRVLLKSQDLKKFPCCVIGQVEARFPNKKQEPQISTGTLINERYVITVSHGLYQHIESFVEPQNSDTSQNILITKRQPIDIRFYLKVQDKNQQFKVIRIFDNKQYFKNSQYFGNQDYVVLQLQKRVPKKKSSKQQEVILRYLSSDQIIKQIIKNGCILQMYDTPVLGSQYNMYQSQGSIKSGQYPRIQYDINTDKGSSGAPIFLRKNMNEYYMIGIHQGTYQIQKDKKLRINSKQVPQLNFGLAFSQKIRNFIQRNLKIYCHRVQCNDYSNMKYPLKFISDIQFQSFEKIYSQLVSYKQNQSLNLLEQKCPQIYILMTENYKQYSLKLKLEVLLKYGNMQQRTQQKLRQLMQQLFENEIKLLKIEKQNRIEIQQIKIQQISKQKKMQMQIKEIKEKCLLDFKKQLIDQINEQKNKHKDQINSIINKHKVQLQNKQKENDKKILQIQSKQQIDIQNMKRDLKQIESKNQRIQILQRQKAIEKEKEKIKLNYENQIKNLKIQHERQVQKIRQQIIVKNKIIDQNENLNIRYEKEINRIQNQQLKRQNQNLKVELRNGKDRPNQDIILQIKMLPNNLQSKNKKITINMDAITTRKALATLAALGIAYWKKEKLIQFYYKVIAFF